MSPTVPIDSRCERLTSHRCRCHASFVEAGKEAAVVAAFVAWLRRVGWKVETEVDFADVVAQRGDERLIAEAKGTTTEHGTDVDTMYGQVLRRMDASANATYAVVVPGQLADKALRVSEDVRSALGLGVFSVAMDDSVIEH